MQSIVSVVLLPMVGKHVQGAMENIGHLQFKAEREVKGVAAESAHVAFTTKEERVGSEMSHSFSPHPIVTPQLKGSTFRFRFKLIKANNF